MASRIQRSVHGWGQWATTFLCNLRQLRAFLIWKPLLTSELCQQMSAARYGESIFVVAGCSWYSGWCLEGNPQRARCGTWSVLLLSLFLAAMMSFSTPRHQSRRCERRRTTQSRQSTGRAVLIPMLQGTWCPQSLDPFFWPSESLEMPWGRCGEGDSWLGGDVGIVGEWNATIVAQDFLQDNSI